MIVRFCVPYLLCSFIFILYFSWWSQVLIQFQDWLIFRPNVWTAVRVVNQLYFCILFITVVCVRMFRLFFREKKNYDDVDDDVDDDESVNQPTKQSINQAINQSTKQSINQSTKQSIIKLINQPITETNQLRTIFQLNRASCQKLPLTRTASRSLRWIS